MGGAASAVKIGVWALRFVVAAVVAIAAATSIAGRPLFTVPSQISGWITVVIVTAFILALQGALWAFETWSLGRVALVEGRKRFYDYFAEWYREADLLKIACNDLAWLDSPASAQTLSHIRSCGANATIYLADATLSNQVLVDLQSSGVTIKQVPFRISSKVSLKQFENNEEIIIRTASRTVPARATKKIWIIKTEEQYQLKMVRELFSAFEWQAAATL